MLQRCLSGFLFCAILAGTTALSEVSVADSSAAVKPTTGTIVGIVSSGANHPVAGATITVTRADGGAIRATVTGSDGLYSFADVAPGAWLISVQTGDDSETSASTVQIVASRATRYDIVIDGAPTAVTQPAHAALAPPQMAPRPDR